MSDVFTRESESYEGLTEWEVQMARGNTSVEDRVEAIESELWGLPTEAMRQDPATADLVKEYDEAMDLMRVMGRYPVESREDFEMIEDIKAGVNPRLLMSRINDLRDELKRAKKMASARRPEEVDPVPMEEWAEATMDRMAGDIRASLKN